MQLRYVFTELGQGLRRNVSMHIAVVLTLFVSLTLVGLGVLLNKQADKTGEYWGNQLQIIAYLCNEGDAKAAATCTGEVTDAQREVILDTIRNNPEVASLRTETQEEAYAKAKRLIPEAFENDDVITPNDMREAVWITLKDPQHYEGVSSAILTLDGVKDVNDMRGVLNVIFTITDVFKYGALAIAGFLVFAALLLVANTIRLAAFARRKEIGIMRLVGASTLYIVLPFLLEAVVTALVGIALAGGALWAVVQFGVQGRLVDAMGIIPWVGNAELQGALLIVGVLGLLLTVIPTLLLTRKYLKV